MVHEQTKVANREAPLRPRTVAPRSAPGSERPPNGVRRPAVPSGRAKYWPGLDGMRALAVSAVVMYHMEPNWLPGGFFGVDIFFVVSGYLITSMLVQEWSGRGRIDLPRFWMRRVRRLYPAVAVLLVVLVPVTAIVAPTALASTRTTIPAALVYLTNWWFIYHHVPYFQTFGRPPLLIHFWSLAIEEQYYLVWPPILAVLLVRWRRPARVALVAVVAAVTSSVLMAVLFHNGSDVNRIYYGSDTHCQGLLLGSALGLVVPPAQLSAAVSAPARRLIDVVGGAAIVALVVLMVTLGQGSSFTWRGGLVLVVILAGIAVVAAAHPASRMSGALSVRPLRWIGTRSYSIYLWHWPILDLTRPHLDIDLGGFPLGLLRLALILGTAEASYRFVEQPWRTGRAQRYIKALLAKDRRQRRAMFAGAACVAIAVAGLVVTAPSPVPPASIAGLETPAARNPIGRFATPTTTPAPKHKRRHHKRRRAPATTTVTTTTTTIPGVGAVIKAPPGGTVLAVGDSVMLGASDDLAAAFGHSIDVDAEVGRQVDVGLQRLAAYKAEGDFNGLRALVIGLGTNGPFEPSQMAQLISLCRGVRRVVLINVRVPDSWQSTSNQTIESVADRPGFTVVDWYDASANPALLYPDETHPDPAGQVVYANLVEQAVTGR